MHHKRTSQIRTTKKTRAARSLIISWRRPRQNYRASRRAEHASGAEMREG